MPISSGKLPPILIKAGRIPPNFTKIVRCCHDFRSHCQTQPRICRILIDPPNFSGFPQALLSVETTAPPFRGW